MWTRVDNPALADRYAAVLRAGGRHYGHWTGGAVARQMNRPGFHYWLYEVGGNRSIVFMYRYVPDSGYLCKVLQFEQVGMGYGPAATLLRAKLLQELDRQAIDDFESAPIRKDQPDKLAAVRAAFSEIVSETDQRDRVRFRLRRATERRAL